MTSLVLTDLAVFFAALIVTLVLTPLIREMNRAFGMVDKPDARRINKVPIPRGGGLAIVVSVLACYTVALMLDDHLMPIGGSYATYLRVAVLALLLAAIGYLDDRFSLKPHVKLAGQFVVAALTWAWAGLSFARALPSLPTWLDACMTILWILGAVNAFNLIDGLDGLASGLALIATIGMGGVMACTGAVGGLTFYFAFAGALLGFLRYNYNPASVFLGDCGSMYLGYVLACLALCSPVPDSLLVSIGVPMLAMGVPIFDTALAIVRRTVRHLLNRQGGEGHVMTADTDHLHHRILRSVGNNQRKAAWTLYAMALFCVLTGIVGLVFENRAAGIWILALVIVSYVIFKDLARIELFDAGRLLDTVAHNRQISARRRWARLAVPTYVVFDFATIILVFFAVTGVLGKPLLERRVMLAALPIRVMAIFVFLILFRVYRTVWSRAMLSNYLRLFVACLMGSLIGTVCIYYLPGVSHEKLLTGTILYALLPFVLLAGLRQIRSIVRDFFYYLDCQRLKGRKDVSRILVYGAGLRYRTFRRELVRHAAANGRIIVGLLDDDIVLRGHYIGGLRVLGPLANAPEYINALNVDGIVVTFEANERWKEIIRQILAPTGVKVTYFNFAETEL